MLRRILITIGLLGLSCSVPARAQNKNDEEYKFDLSMGGGLTVPLNPIARFVGVGGSFLTSGGIDLDQHNAIVGEFMWNGLPPNEGAIAQLNGISKNSNLYSLTADYKYKHGFGKTKTFGYYTILGGGWYYRNSSISKSTFVNTPTVCTPVWSLYGFTCTDGFVNTVGVSAGTSSIGVNGGIGLTVKIAHQWKFFMESRYVYAASRAIATQVAPVIFGIAFQ